MASMNNVFQRRMRWDMWISGLALGLALFTCVGCGGGHDSGSTADALAPGTARPTRTPIRAAFTATAGGTAPRTATPTRSGQVPSARTAIPPRTPVTGTETVTPTVSATPTKTLPAEPHGVLSIGRAQGEPGAIVSVDVTLTVDQGVDIAGTQNDLFFDPNQIAVLENPDGDPDCAVNPQLAKEATAFSFQPPGCGAGGGCMGVRALVLSFSNVDPIPSGSRLYTCNVAISAGAQPGAVYALPCSQAGASSPEGGTIEIECEDGEIEVVGGAPVPAQTPDPLAEGTCYESSTCDQFPMPTTHQHCCDFWRNSGLPCTWCPADMIDPSSGSCTQCVHPCEGLPTPTPTPTVR